MLGQLTKTKKLLKRQLNKLSDASGDTKNADMTNITANMSKVAASMATLGKELRSWEDRVKKRVTVLSNEDRYSVIIRFLESLPPGEQVLFIDRLKASNPLTSALRSYENSHNRVPEGRKDNASEGASKQT